MSPEKVLKDLVTAAIAWRRTKVQMMKLADSRSSTKEVIDNAKKNHIEAIHKLDAAIGAFEALQSKFRVEGPKKAKKAFPWKKTLDALAAGSLLLKNITDEPALPTNVIDVKGEVVG